LETGLEKMRFGRAVLAAGPWVGDLAPEVANPLSVTRQYQSTFEVSDRSQYRPVTWIDVQARFYGRFTPVRSSPSSRSTQPAEAIIASHLPGEVVKVDDHIDLSHTKMRADEALSYLERRLSTHGTPPKLLTTRVCHYTSTPDRDFILDFEDRDRKVVLLSACSGHGFKLAPLMGELAADAIETGEVDPRYRARFSLDRFVA